jgi:hypothetical protein
MRLADILREIVEERSFTNDAILNSFLNKLGEKGSLYRNPINSREFIYKDMASLEFNRFDMKDRNEVSLQDIAVFEKGVGNGSKVMKDITDTADELNIKLTLSASPFGRDSKALGKKELIDFYKRNGFEVSPRFLQNMEFDNDEEAIYYVVHEDPSEDLDMERDPR